MCIFPFPWGSKISSSSRAGKVLNFGARRQDLVVLHEAWKKLWLEKGDWKGSLQQSCKLSSDFTGCEWGSRCLSLPSHPLKLGLLLGIWNLLVPWRCREGEIGNCYLLPLPEATKEMTTPLDTESIFVFTAIWLFLMIFLEIAGKISQLNMYPYH